MTTAVANLRNAAGLGKTSTTPAPRSISLLSRSIGLFDPIFCQWGLGKRRERQDDEQRGKERSRLQLRNLHFHISAGCGADFGSVAVASGAATSAR